jgi:hypothetical protein
MIALTVSLQDTFINFSPTITKFGNYDIIDTEDGMAKTNIIYMVKIFYKDVIISY